MAIISLLVGLLAAQRTRDAPDNMITVTLDERDPRWTNDLGGPLIEDNLALLVSKPPSARAAAAEATPSARAAAAEAAATAAGLQAPAYWYARLNGYLDAGHDIKTLVVTNVTDGLDACSALILCRGITFNSSGPNGTIRGPTMVYLKSSAVRAHRSGAPWSTWLKEAPVMPPAHIFDDVGGVALALRQDTLTVQWLNATRPGVSNFSFVPPLRPSSALPLVQHLGDITLRVRVRGSPSGAPTNADWQYFASAWAPFAASASPVGLRRGELAAHDITPLLEATDIGEQGGRQRSPVHVRRAYQAPEDGPGVVVSFELFNAGAASIEIGGFGMACPHAVSQDVHIGGAHGWVEWLRVHVNDALQLDQQCLVATPMNSHSALEAFRPIFEFHGGGFEWVVHSAAWAAEWESNRQWPFLYMASQLNETGIWPRPRSPWPSWGDGGQTVRTNVSRSTHWNVPTSTVLAPGERVTYGIRLSACPGGPRTRDAALAAAGAPLLRGVPGFTISTEMTTAALYVTPPTGVRVAAAAASAPEYLRVGSVAPPLPSGATRISVGGLRRGRSRLEVRLTDGTVAVAHYLVLPPLPHQIANVTAHWANVAWLPRDYPGDPFGRGASVMPYDREDGRIRLNDARAYDVGLSDDAGAANNLGLASSQMFAPTALGVGRLDEYIHSTLYGVKTDTAKPPFKSLQMTDGSDGVRMTLFYYNQTNFPWNYTEARECGIQVRRTRVPARGSDWGGGSRPRRRSFDLGRACPLPLPTPPPTTRLAPCSPTHHQPPPAAAATARTGVAALAASLC